MKKLLYYDDLYDFYLKQNKSCTFSAKESGHQIFVHVPATFKADEKEDTDNFLLFCTVKIMHSGKNRNGSSVTDEARQNAAKHLAYKPILANFVEYTDEATGETLKDFGSHDMELNDDGTTNYIEKQVGCFTADEPYFEVEEETGHNFLYGRCAIPVDYTDAASIIERKNGTKVSVELAVNELSFEVDTKTLILSDVDIMGTTLLGRDRFTLEEVGEGMKNARLDIEDFSADNNSLFTNFNQKMIDLQERLEKLESTCFNKNKSEQETVQNNTRKEDMSTVENENKDMNFEEVTDTEEVTTTGETTEEEVAATETESEDTTVEESSDETVDETVATETESAETSEIPAENFEVMTRSFELSHSDVRYGLYKLLKALEESDNTWYWICEVYDTYFVYESYDESKIYRQGYVKDNEANTVAFDGDRVELFRELLTANEKAELEAMRANYAELKSFKENFEANELHAQKEEVVNSEKYAVLAEKNESGEYINADFAKLVAEMDNYSLADLETQIKILHSDFIADHSTFAEKKEEKPTTSMKQFSIPSKRAKKPSRYGNLFPDKD